MDNLALKDLQKIILGNRKEPLSSIEVRNLFSYPTTPEFILYVITGLNQKKLDPNLALIQGIANATKKEDLIAIALALRYGADPNLYVNAANIGDVHILGYAHLVLSKRNLPVLNSVIIMLSVMGANSNMLIFDNKGGIVKDEFSLVEPLKGQGVLEWLDDQGFDTILPQIQKGYKKVEKKFMTTIATFLDKEKLLVTDPRLDEVIAAHSNIIFNKYGKNADSEKGFRVARKYLNLTAFEFFVNQGASLNYGEINDLILSMIQYQRDNDLISLSQIRQMLLYLVQHGTSLDTYQEELLKFDQTIYNMVIKEYEVPYWKKVCSFNKASTPDKLKELAYKLNLDPEAPKEIICSRIKRILQTDPEQTKKNVIERQKNRIHSSASYINESDMSGLSCSNRSVLKTNIYDYPDVDIAFYRDFQENLWCFTSNNFRKILEQKKNPYTVQNFPNFFIKQVEDQVKFIENYRSLDDHPTPISVTLDGINQNDKITNNYFDRSIKMFKEMGVLNGITEYNLEKLSKKDMERLLSSNFGVNVNLEGLKKEHALKTFILVSYSQIKTNPEFTEKFFESIVGKSSVGQSEFGLNEKVGTQIGTDIPKIESLRESVTDISQGTSVSEGFITNDEQLGSSTLDENSFPI